MAAAPLGAFADPVNGTAVITDQANASGASAAPQPPQATSFRDKVRAAFGLPPLAKSSPTAPVKSVSQPAAPVQTPVVARVGYSVYAPVANPQGKPAAVEQPRPQVAAKYKAMVGHEADYSWITGQLYYVHADGGMWVVRYANVGEVDRYGGSVVLTPTVEMRNFREGDLVNVCGEILNNGLPVRNLGGALYRVNSIQMIERNDSRW